MPWKYLFFILLVIANIAFAMLSIDPSDRWVLNPNLQSFLNFSLISIVFLILMISIGVFTGLTDPVFDRIRDNLVAPAINKLLRENPDFLSEYVDKIDIRTVADMVNRLLRSKPDILSERIRHLDIDLVAAALNHLLRNNPDLMKKILTGLDGLVLMESINRAETPLVILFNELCEKDNLLGAHNLRVDAAPGNQIQLTTPMTIRFKGFVKGKR
jgi:hypothetical protein